MTSDKVTSDKVTSDRKMEELKKKINREDEESVASSGMDLSEKTRSASFLQEDNKVLFYNSLLDGIDILSTKEALEKYPEVKSYYGKAFKMLNRDFPGDIEGGYFIRVKKGKTVELPIQACLFLKTQGFKQKVHLSLIHI